jgi:transcriptional regulator with XRE-family HTH domain
MTKLRSNRSTTEGDVYIGQRICEARFACGISQEVLAKKLGVSFQQVQKYENGTNRISAVRLTQLAGKLDQPVTFFLPDSGDVRAKTNPVMLRFLATKEGFAVANDWFRMSPGARRVVFGVIKEFRQAGA